MANRRRERGRAACLAGWGCEMSIGSPTVRSTQVRRLSVLQQTQLKLGAAVRTHQQSCCLCRVVKRLSVPR
jgi:hypothetical protein